MTPDNARQLILDLADDMQRADTSHVRRQGRRLQEAMNVLSPAPDQKATTTLADQFIAAIRADSAKYASHYSAPTDVMNAHLVGYYEQTICQLLAEFPVLAHSIRWHKDHLNAKQPAE